MLTVNSMINGFISSIQKQNGSIKLGNVIFENKIDKYK